MKNKFLLIAGLALATPAMTVLPGCNGGSGGPLSEPAPGSSAFAGVSASGQVTNSTGGAIGTLNFSVANNGTINGTLDTTPTAPLSTRAVISGSGQVDSDGNFSITFIVPQNGQNVTYTFTGKLVKDNGIVTAANLTYEASDGTNGSFNLTLTTPAPTPTATPGNTPAPAPTATPVPTPGGETGATSFSFNAQTGDFNAANDGLRDVTGTGIRATANNLNVLTLTFNSVTSPTDLRNLTVTLVKSGEFVVGDSFTLSDSSNSPTAGQGTVLYGEGVPTNKAWISASGRVLISALNGNNVTISAVLIRMNPAPLAGPGQTNQATGSFTLLGNGSATLSG